MAETTLKTRIKLLYKSYTEWEAIKTTFFPLMGEVCITHIPQTSGLDICMIKVGQWDGVDGSTSKKSYSELPYLYANSADVYDWAKKENLDFNDLDATFLAALDARIAEKSENTEYQMVGENGVWKLQKREIGAETWTDVSTVDVASYVTPLINEEATARQTADATLQSNITAEATTRATEDAKKVDKQIVGTNGTAEIFNESDGGGAHFIHTDGSESFVGVNDGGKTGMMAQIYADVVEDGAWVGSRINVYHNGIYYVSKSNQKAGYAKNAAEMEIATKKDIQDLGSVLHFVGIAEQQTGETEAEAVERTFPIAEQTAGAVAICGNKEFVAAGDPLAWKEFGDVSAYATKAELQAEATTRATEDATLQANINAEETRAIAAEATKTDKEITGTNGKALIFNESDGGGAKFEHNDGTWSFAGVNDAGADGIAAQIYAVDSTNNYKGAKLDVTKGGMYYTTGETSGLPATQRDVEANEIAVKGEITSEATARAEADTELQTNIDAEATARAAADTAINAAKLDKLPNVDDPTDPGYGMPYHIPYDIGVNAGTSQIDLTVKTITLDNNLTKMNFDKTLPGATQSTAGLMSSTDKAKLDNFYARDLTQEDDDVLILNCNY